MIDIKQNFSLKKLNTFGLDVKADRYIKYDSKTDIQGFLKNQKISNHYLILGGGSNLLFDGDFDGDIFHSFINHIKIVKENEDSVLIRVGSGVEWDSLVSWSVDNNYYGIENLSYIPGVVGAAPVQNIGAYGVEFKDVFVKAEGVYIENGDDFSIEKSQANYGYRDSIFKRQLKDKVIITDVYIKLLKNGTLHLDYGAVNEHVEHLGGATLKNVRDAIIFIRKSKLPDPEEIGNAGSFFKNPVVSFSHFEKIKSQFPNMPFYLQDDKSLVKIPAGWLIETCGWKGKAIGNAAVHDKQALVLINKGEATGKEILNRKNEIQN